MKRLLTAASTGALLLPLWIGLWGELTIGNVVGGVLAIGFLLVLFPFASPRWRHIPQPVAFARLVGFTVVALVKSSLAVARTVLVPTPARLRTDIVTVDLQCASPLTVSTVANLITLTPGTLTVTASTEPPRLEVHVLGLGDPDDFRAEIAQLERLVVAAFRPSLEPTGSRP